jgi:hypothetical protein
MCAWKLSMRGFTQDRETFIETVFGRISIVPIAAE